MSDILVTKVGGPNFIRKLNANGVVVGVDGVNPEDVDTNPAVTECTATACNSRLIPDGATITIDTFTSVCMNLESPSGDFPIPETEDFGNIVVKAEGNRLSFLISWVLKEESATIVSGYACPPTVTTVQQQIDYWLNVFQAYSIEGKYRLTIDGIVRIGYIRSIKFSKDANSPITYNASLDFIAGDVVAGES